MSADAAHPHDDPALSVTPDQVGDALVIDVRRAPARAALPQALPGAFWRDPAQAAAWATEWPADRDIVVYCVHGHEVSQQAAAQLRAAGRRARYLAGGLAGRQASGRPLAPSAATRWVTRERPKIDRIACPWLVLRFIDPTAEFLYVPAGEVLAVAQRSGATPYDIPGVAYSHAGEACSFDAFIARHALADPALQTLAAIVRGADTSRLDLTPQSAGLYALSLGLSLCFDDDHAMLRQGLVMYDALYAWCRHGQGETHRWPPAMA